MSAEIYYRGIHESAYDVARWRKACYVPARGVDSDALRDEIERLYEHMPEGKRYHREMPVILKPGERVQRHRHPEYTGIYYVAPVGCALIVVTAGGVQRILPEPGEFIVLNPMVEHAVEKNVSDRVRLSVALRVDT